MDLSFSSKDLALRDEARRFVDENCDEDMRSRMGEAKNGYLDCDTWAKTNEPRPGPDFAAPVAPYYFNLRKASIYAGSNEIQRNIMAKAVLGL